MEDGDEEYYNNLVERILAGTMEPTRLPLKILARITKNFSEKRKIGEGGFGEVYEGVLHNQDIIAVKRIKMNSDTVDDSIFSRELENLLHTMKHPNVVRFLGYCYELFHEGIKGIGPEKFRCPQTRERLLCFEYISNGSLDKHITDELRGLEWNTRFQIIKGICQGLQYLHQGRGIIHMDLNPRNIMVDHFMVPKITDFGLARLSKNSHTAGQPFVTRGYFAPEYGRGGPASVKCDIYGLGVIILELVTGLQDIPDKTNVLRRWKWSYKWNRSARQLPLQAEEVTKCIEIGKRCRQEEPQNRPDSISEIISNLNEIDTRGDIFAVDQIETSDDDMLGIKPLELRFGFQTNKQISSEVEVMLTNETGNCVAFYIEAGLPLKCSKRKGIVQANGTCVVIIALEAQEATTLSSMPDKVIVKSTKVNEGLTYEDVTRHMFDHEAPNLVDDVNLTVVYDEPEKPVSKDDNITSSSPKDRRLNFLPPHKTLARQAINKQASNNQAVDVETGAMGPLLSKLCQLIKLTQNLWQTWMEKDMKRLNKDLKYIQANLSMVLQKKHDDLLETDKLWVRQVKELSYDTEDLVDGLLRVCTEGSEPTANQQELQKTINDNTDRAHELYERRPEQTAGDNVATPAADKNYDPHQLPSKEDHKKLVGIIGTRDELVKRLSVNTKQLKIMSIFGYGGVGKTTLVRAVYDHLSAIYILKAFVMVGRNRDINWVLEEILLRLNKDKYSEIHTRRWDETRLIEELRDDVLQNKRYLIVIDDILWDKQSWDIIKEAFRGHNCGSRVITTSRVYEVAAYSDEVYNLEPLPGDHSKELFYARLQSGGKDMSNLDETEEQCTTEILKKCGGVPLAIITMASLLVQKPKEDWPEVYKSIGLFGDEENEDVDRVRKILKFSYYDLPRHLKTCLLYLSTFSEDSEIEKNTLVWRWVAEGFVHEEKGKTLFMVGESYFNQLIDRSLLQPVEGTSYTIHICHVHDMVLDMICSVAKEENFVSTMLDSIEQHPPSESIVRRLCVQNRNVTQQDLAQTCNPEQLRSFNAIWCGLSLLPSFQVLRLLSMDYCWLPGDHTVQSITGCHHLRYLGLSRTNIGDLPMELGQLRYLQTLDLRGTALKALPQSVTLMSQLTCLRSEGTKMALPDGMGGLTSLEELRLDNVGDSPNFVKELGKLTNLRILHIGTFMFGDSLNEALVESLSRLKKIEELELCDGGRCKPPTWHNFSPSREIRHLLLHNIRYSHGLPEWIKPAFLPHLCHLNVHVKSAEAQDLVNLGNFQELASLCLFIRRDRIFPCAIAAGAYPKLQYYYMFAPLKFLPGAAPYLQTIEFHVDAKVFRDLKPNLDSLVNLPSLMRVHAKIICWDVTMQVAIAAEEALRHAIRLHDKRPILVLERCGSCVDYFELKSNSDIENVMLDKVRRRIQIQAAEDDKLEEELDPMDPEVISRNLKFKVDLPSIIESIHNEMLDEGLPSMLESVLNEMLAESRQREGGASSSRQVISRNSNSEAPLASMIKSTINRSKSIINAVMLYEGRPGGASNSEQIDSSDIEVILESSYLKAQLISTIKTRIDMMCGKGVAKKSNSEQINSTDQQISGNSSNIGEVLMKTLFDCQMYEGKQGWAEESDFEQINSIDQEVISRNLNFNGQPNEGLPYLVESVLNEMLDEHREREAGAYGSRKVISRNSNFDAPLPSMIKSIIKEVLDEAGQGDPEAISHDPDLKDALTSAIKSRIDSWAQGEAKESDSEHIDMKDQEIGRCSSSNSGAVRMKTLLISQMYEGKQGGQEDSNSKHTNSTGPEVISHNSNSSVALHSVFQSTLRESNSEHMNSIEQEDISHNLNFNGQVPSIHESILDEIPNEGLPYMAQSVLNEMLDEHRQREAEATGSRKIISRNSNFDAPLPSMIKSIIKEALDEGGHGDPEAELERRRRGDCVALNCAEGAAPTRTSKWLTGLCIVESVLNEMLDEHKQREAGTSGSHKDICRNSNFDAPLPSMIKSTEVLDEGGQGDPEVISHKFNSAHPQGINHNLNFNGQLPSIHESILDEILDKGLPYIVESVLNEMLDEHKRRESGASSSQKVISHNSNFDDPLPSMIKSVIKEVLDEGGQGDPEVISHDPDLKDALTSVIKSRINNWAQGEAKESDSEHIDTTDQEMNSGSSSNTRAVWMKTQLISQMYEGKQGGVQESNSKHTNSTGPEVISQNSNSSAALHSVFQSIIRECNYEHMMISRRGQLCNSSPNCGVIWDKVLFVIEMLERKKRDAEEADFEQIASMDLELPQPQLQSQEERPAEVHQQHFRFSAVMPIAEK